MDERPPDPIIYTNRITTDREYLSVSTNPLALRPAQLPLPLETTHALRRAGQAADAAAARQAFAAYRAGQADETRRRQDTDLATFATFLGASGANPNISEVQTQHLASLLASDPTSWAAITWGLVEGFVAWQLAQGYAIGSINVRLSTVKTYARLAAKAGALDPEAYALIKLVAGYRHREGVRLDARRPQTRKGAKKADPVSISHDQAARLKAQFDPRDRLLMCLLLDHGLRVGEVAALTADDFDLRRGVLRFYRSKVDKTQQHRLSGDTAAAAAVYLPMAPDGPLFGVDRTIRTRVGQLGQACGLVGLSPHDCRHAWATFAMAAGTPVKALQDAGGWSSPAMPLRYAESAEIANDGVTLD